MSNFEAHISATGDPIYFMFRSRVGYSGSAVRMALFPVRSNPGLQPVSASEVTTIWRYTNSLIIIIIIFLYPW